jgi:inhibitor of KinA sporulation pathway (predicted exonuclease)
MILVIDLEATCDEGPGVRPEDMEIIEVGAVWADLAGQVLDTFQILVRPVLNPRLTAFCQQLTGIRQEDVDRADTFPAAAAALAPFAQRHSGPEAIWGSWGQFDARQLDRDCARHTLPSPLAGFRHINLKRQFARTRRIKGSLQKTESKAR